MVDHKISVVRDGTRKGALSWNEVFSSDHLNLVVRFDVVLGLHFLNKFLG
jgi:hypothetical protein